MIRTRLMLVLLVSMMLVPTLKSGVQQGDAPADQNFAGTVYDLDYLGRQGWTQVLIRPTVGSNLVATTKSELLQNVLEIALSNAIPVKRYIPRG